MTNTERLFAALYLSEPWHIWFAERPDLPMGRRLYARTRAVVLYDRVLNDEYVSTDENGKAFRALFKAEPMNQGSWI